MGSEMCIRDRLKTVQTHPNLVLQEFAHGTHAAVAEVIDVVELSLIHI